MKLTIFNVHSLDSEDFEIEANEYSDGRSKETYGHASIRSSQTVWRVLEIGDYTRRWLEGWSIKESLLLAGWKMGYLIQRHVE